LKSEQSLNNCKTILCTELGPAQCYSTAQSVSDSRRLSTARSATPRRAAAVPTMPASLRCRRRVSLLPRLLYVPAMQPLHSPRAGARPLLHPVAAVPSAVLHNCHQIHRRSSALRDTHPKPTTALPTDPSNSTTDRSSDRSPTTPLRLSCRERLHAHRCLRSSSIPATTP
jgi:hypothetical protein